MRDINQLAEIAARVEGGRPRSASLPVVEVGALAAIHRRLGNVERDAAAGSPAPRRWEFLIFHDPDSGQITRIVATAVDA